VAVHGVLRDMLVFCGDDKVTSGMLYERNYRQAIEQCNLG
jgi:hypothetical protein